MVAIELRVQQALPDLLGAQEAVRGIVRAARQNGGNDGSQFGSTYGICDIFH